MGDKRKIWKWIRGWILLALLNTAVFLALIWADIEYDDVNETQLVIYRIFKYTFGLPLSLFHPRFDYLLDHSYGSFQVIQVVNAFFQWMVFSIARLIWKKGGSSSPEPATGTEDEEQFPKDEESF
ncbi:MAG: hypothetical protein H6581_07050 [Bacteroidia bacterium]|nr:hypothetical protein [Bacteroidia bacterium]